MSLPTRSARSLVAPAPEAARSLLVAGTTVALHLQTVPGLVVVGGHAGDRSGRLIVPTSPDCRVLAAVTAAGSLPARAVVTDVAALPLRSRVRGRLTLHGRLTAVPVDDAATTWTAATGDDVLDPDRRLLRLTAVGVRLERYEGSTAVAIDVDPDDYALADPDPLARHEAEVLSHLVTGHPDEVARLERLLPRRAVAGARRVVPVRLDRRSLVLRVERDAGDRDVPVALASARAQHPGEVLAALRALLDTCPRGADRH